MTILWFGGEEIDFPNGGSGLYSTNSSYYRSSYARVAIVNSTTSPMKSMQFSEVVSGWLSFRARHYNPSADVKCIGLANHASGYKGIFVGVSSSGSKLGLWKYDGSWTLLASEAGTSLSGNVSRVKFDIQIVSYGASATVRIYQEGSLLIEYSGDISISGVSGFDVVSIIGSNANMDMFSEIIVADEDTRLMYLRTIAPSAAGDASEWDGTYENIDEVTLSDADTIYTATADENFQCNLTGMPAGDYIVKAVKVVARCTDGVGGMGIKMGIKTNSTVVLSDAITLGGYWESHEVIYNENPVTLNRFTPAEIEALQIAFQSVEV